MKKLFFIILFCLCRITFWGEIKNNEDFTFDAPSDYITFADGKIRAFCVSNWDAKNDGELSFEEAGNEWKDLETMVEANNSLMETDYCFQNVETGLWLSGANDCGTRASLIAHPRFFGLEIQDNQYVIDSYGPYYSLCYLGLANGIDVYIDANWINDHLWTISSSDDGMFTMQIENTYLGYDGASTVLTLTSAENGNYSKWRIFSRAEMLDNLSNFTQKADATWLIDAPNFSRKEYKRGGGAPWTVGGNCTDYHTTGSEINFYARVQNSTFDVYQVINDIPNGTYLLSCQALYKDNSNSSATAPYFYGNDSKGFFSNKVESIEDESSLSDSFLNGDYQQGWIIVYVSDGTLRVGAACDNSNCSVYWDNFELYYLGKDGKITFDDANVKAVCVANWDTNSDGDLSYEEAAQVTDLGTVFKNNKDITSFNELQYFTSLGNIAEQAFAGCSNLTSITIPRSVNSIGIKAFEGCANLSSIVVDAANTKYNSRSNCNSIIETATNTLIAGCNNTVIPNNVTSIASYAFSECTGLVSITIPNAVASIGDYAFNNCSGLQEVAVSWLTPLSINTTTFNGVNLSNVILSVYAKDTDIYQSANIWKDFGTISRGPIQFADKHVKALCVANWDTNEDGELSYEEAAAVTDLGDVFKGNQDITSFNEFQYFVGVASIGDYAFSSCMKLTSIEIPNSVKSIGHYAFHYCVSLTSINIPNSVTGTGFKVFDCCFRLKSVTISNSLSIIEGGMFSGCDSLSSIEIPNSVREIASHAFEYCRGLKSIIIPNSVRLIGNNVFSYCQNLTSIEIPNSVKQICIECFANCESLSDVIVNWNSPSLVNCVLTLYDNFNLHNTTLHVPEGTVDSYLSMEPWKIFGTITDGQKTIATVFEVDGIKYKLLSYDEKTIEVTYREKINGEDNDYSGDIVIPSQVEYDGNVYSVVSIGNNAFYECSGLTSITIPSSITSIGNYAFQDCTGLTSFTTNVADPATITLGTDVWNNVDLSDVPLTAPNKESLKKYSEAAQWSAFKYDIPKEVSLDENSDITSQLEKLVNDGKRVDFTINRTFYCDGYFNTICLPFSMTAAEIAASPIGGYKELKKFVQAEVKGKGKDMNVNVGLSATKEIEAGVPYLISWNKGANIVNPTFENVLVTESVGKTISGGGMSYIGILTPTVLDPTGNNLLFLGENNLLYWSSDNTALRAFRAYFSVNSVSMVNFRKDMPAFFVDIDEVTGIGEVEGSISKVQSVKYLENGKVVIERNGVKYDAMGRVIK